MQTVRVLVPILGLLAVPLNTTILLAQTERTSRVASSPEKLIVDSGPFGNIAMHRDALPGMDQESAGRLAAALRQAGFGVTFLSAKQAADPHVLTPQRFFLYILPHAQVYPADGFRALADYLRGGGHVIFLGGPALTRSVWSYQNQWIDQAEIRARISKLATDRVVFDFEGDSPAGRRGTDNPKRKPHSRPSKVAPANLGRCVKVSTARLTGWNTYASPRQENLFARGHELLCFWARGDSRTSQMLVEMDEADRSRWMAVVPLTTRWTYHVVSPDDFQFWPDASNSGRGGPGDRFHPAQRGPHRCGAGAEPLEFPGRRAARILDRPDRHCRESIRRIEVRALGAIPAAGNRHAFLQDVPAGACQFRGSRARTGSD